MSIDLISDSAERLFSKHGRDVGAVLWQLVEEAGYPLAHLSEDEGGFGLAPIEAMAPVRIAARHAAALPLAETMAANWLLAKAGLPLAEGPAALAGTRASHVPWGRSLNVLVVATPTADGVQVSRIDVAGVGWTEGVNIANEPRDDAVGDLAGGDHRTAALDPQIPQALMALLRAQQMAGAIEAALALSVRYAGERVQFGRPLARFQVIQQYLAVMADEAAAAGAAAAMGALALPQAHIQTERFILLAAAAKLRTGEAAGKVAELAHQVHGAIGFSQEYPLHRLTCRLWAWRDEDGRDAEWAQVLGAAFLGQRSECLWPRITTLQSDFF